MKIAIFPMLFPWLLTGPPAASFAEDSAPYVITGTVADASGSPIKGAIVEWARWRDREGLRQTKTDGEGRYRLEVEEGGQSWLLFASAKGFAPAWKGNFLFQPRGMPTNMDFQLSVGHWLDGHVVNDLWEPIPGLTVKVTREVDDSGITTWYFDPTPRVAYEGMDLPGEGRETVTDEKGYFRFDSLPAGKVRIWIDDRKWDQYSENNEADQPVTIVLEERYADWDKMIRGRVLDDETGEPVPEFTVRIYGKEKTFRSEEGRFEFPGLFGYRYGRVFVTADGNRCAVGREITAEPEEAAPEHKFRLKNQGLEGYVVNAVTGERLAGVTVSHGFGDMDRLSWDYQDEWDHNTGPLRNLRTVVSGDDGSFHFAEPADEKGIIVIRQEPYERMFLAPDDRVIDPETGRLRVELHPEATLSGVYLREGKPVSHESVRLARGSVLYEDVTTDEAGRFSFRCLGPGTYRLAVYTRVGDMGFPIVTGETEVAAGEHKKLNLTGPDGPFTITGRTLSGGRVTPWMPVFLAPRKEGLKSAYTCSNGEGRFRISGLDEGPYDGSVGLQGIPRGKKDFTIEITGNAEMDLPPAEE